MNPFPYRSEIKNIQKETSIIQAPTTINNRPFFIKQTGLRTIEDKITTEILLNPINPFPFQTNSNMYANPISVPGGVVFTFSNNQAAYSTKPVNNFGDGRLPMTNCCQTETDIIRMQYDLAVKKLEDQIVANMMNQMPPRQIPYKLAFHQNEATSTADLNPTPEKCTCGTVMSDVEMVDSFVSGKIIKTDNISDDSSYCGESEKSNDSEDEESDSCSCFYCKCIDIDSDETERINSDNLKKYQKLPKLKRRTSSANRRKQHCK